MKKKEFVDYIMERTNPNSEKLDEINSTKKILEEENHTETAKHYEFYRLEFNVIDLFDRYHGTKMRGKKLQKKKLFNLVRTYFLGIGIEFQTNIPCEIGELNIFLPCCGLPLSTCGPWTMNLLALTLLIFLSIYQIT